MKIDCTNKQVILFTGHYNLTHHGWCPVEGVWSRILWKRKQMLIMNKGQTMADLPVNNSIVPMPGIDSRILKKAFSNFFSKDYVLQLPPPPFFFLWVKNVIFWKWLSLVSIVYCHEDYRKDGLIVPYLFWLVTLNCITSGSFWTTW